MTLSLNPTGKVVSAAFVVFLLAGGQQAFAGGSWTIKVVNNLSVELTSGKVENRQDIQIKSERQKP